MRPTPGVMLQQNNNNNYPCLNAGATRDMLHKSSLPFPSRLELGLGDLPLIRGLRAWALCSKNRCKAGGLLGGGGQAPIAPPPGGSSPCPRPADGEWGRMGYGLPLGVDTRQAGIGALVTVATLKTSEGGGKTQTQCLFLRTEKGSCLYSGAAAAAASSGVGGWLRGRAGGVAGRGEESRRPGLQTGPNRARVRSGRRWRKSGNAERASAGKERQQRSREEEEEEEEEGERQEEPDKGGPDGKQCPSMQQDGREVLQGREGEGASPRRGDVEGMREERPRNEEEEEEEEGGGGGGGGGGGHSELQSSNSVLPASDSDLESKRLPPQSRGGCDGEEPKSLTPHRMDQTPGSEVQNSKPGPCGGPDAREPSENTSGESSDSESVGSAGSLESSSPAGGSDCSRACRIKEEELPEETGSGEEELDVGLQEPNREESNTVKPQLLCRNEGNNHHVDEREVQPATLRLREPSAVGGTGTENPLDSRLSESEPEKEEARTRNLQGDDRGEGREAERGSDLQGCNEEFEPAGGDSWWEQDVDPCSDALSDPPASLNPDPCAPPPLGTMATRKEEEEEEVVVVVVLQEKGEELGVPAGDGGHGGELEEEEEEERGPTVAAVDVRTEEEEEEEDEFGVFMQADAEAAWSEEDAMSASVPCGSRASVAVESAQWAPAWSDGSSHQSDDTWAAFPQAWSDEGGGAAEQWWARSATDQRRRDGLSTNQNPSSVFSEAFPSSPSGDPWDPCDPCEPCEPCDLHSVPTLGQLLRARHSQDQGLLDSFHDLNKMIGQRYKRANGVSRDLLLTTLHLEPPPTVIRPSASWTSSRRLSPGLPSASRHAHNAAAKRRLSYDHNRNVTE